MWQMWEDQKTIHQGVGLVRTAGDNPPGRRAGEDPRRQSVQVKGEKQQVLQLQVILDG